MDVPHVYSSTLFCGIFRADDCLTRLVFIVSLLLVCGDGLLEIGLITPGRVFLACHVDFQTISGSTCVWFLNVFVSFTLRLTRFFNFVISKVCSVKGKLAQRLIMLRVTRYKFVARWLI